MFNLILKAVVIWHFRDVVRKRSRIVSLAQVLGKDEYYDASTDLEGMQRIIDAPLKTFWAVFKRLRQDIKEVDNAGLKY